MEETWVRRKSLGKEEKRGRRESLGKDFERKLNFKPEMSVEKCKEEIAFYTAQTENFFEDERGLISGGLNPKLAADVAFVTEADIEGLFGKCTKLRTTNTFLDPDARKDLMELYWKIYGSHLVTNNEFSGWLVKGYIANLKKKKVNWALAASTTALEKADRAQRLLLRLMNPESSDEATTLGLKEGYCTSHRDGISSRLGGALVKSKGVEVRPGSTSGGLGFSTSCPYGVSPNDLEVVKDVCKIQGEILVTATSKVKYVEAEYKRISDRLVGFKFTMDDRHITAKEDEEKVLQFQVQFERATKAVEELELQALGISTDSGELEDLEQKLKILRSQANSVERKLEVSKSVADSSRERAMKGQDFYEDIESDQMRVESDLQILRREIVDLEQHSAVVVDQCAQMQKGGGLSLWPKLALHPTMSNDGHVNTPTLQLHPCVFCSRGYPFLDIVIAPCRHIYHISCAAALAKVDHRCLRCHEVFHPHWWQSFGFQVAYSGFEEESLRLELPAQVEAVRQSLKDNGSCRILNFLWKCFILHCCLCPRTQSSLKHSDLGSCGSEVDAIWGHVDPINGECSIRTAGGQRRPSLASYTPPEEPVCTELELAVSNAGRDQEAESPVKTRGVECRAVGDTDVIANPDLQAPLVMAQGGHDKLRLDNDCELPGIPKFRCSLLKRPADLLEDNEDGRKKVALSSLVESGPLVATETDPIVQSSDEETIKRRSLNSGSPKGKAKTRNSKRKPREALPCTPAGRVSTRANTMKR